MNKYKVKREPKIGKKDISGAIPRKNKQIKVGIGINMKNNIFEEIGVIFHIFFKIPIINILLNNEYKYLLKIISNKLENNNN